MNSSIITAEFLRKVEDEEVLCLREGEVNEKKCDKPPKVDSLIEYVTKGFTD